MTIGVEKFQVDVKKRRWGRPKRPMDVKWGTNEYICRRLLNRDDRGSYLKTFKRLLFLSRLSAFCNGLLQLFFYLNEYRDWSKYQIVSWSCGLQPKWLEMQENIARHDNRASSLNLKTVLCSCERFVYLCTILISEGILFGNGSKYINTFPVKL